MQNGPDLDLWQYRLSARGNGRTVAGLSLEVGPDLPLIDLRDHEGRDVGVLLGHPIDLLEYRCVTHVWQVPISSDDPDSFVTALFQRLAGRFLLILDLPGARRVYPDAAAQIPCVYGTEIKLVGSTAHALFSDAEYDALFDKALYSKLGVEGSGWFPAGLTAHRGLDRLLPNHMLDLDTWTVSRHWAPAATSVQANAAVLELIQIVQAQMAALKGSERKIAQALTAGRETRMLLGMAGAGREDRLFVTIKGSDQYSVDGAMAARIASEQRLNHWILPRVRADAQARAAYLRRAGHCVADANSWYFPSVEPIAKTHVFVGGAGGEIGRGFFWKSDDDAETTLDAERLIARLGLPAVPELLTRVEAWLDGLAGRPTTEILDLAYLEQRVGPWGSAQFCADPTLLRFAPLLNRRAIDAMLVLPDEWKMSEGMAHAVLAATWPELEAYPYNTMGPIRDLWVRIQRVMQEPGLILRKIRRAS